MHRPPGEAFEGPACRNSNWQAICSSGSLPTMSNQTQPGSCEFLYRIHPSRADMLMTGPSDTEATIIGQHFEYLKDLTERWVVTLAGRTLSTDPASHGIVIFRAESEADARRIMRDDPAVKNGVFLAELFPFQTALRSGTTRRDPDHG